MKRAVSIIEVADPSAWSEVEDVIETSRVIDARTREVTLAPGALDTLKRRGTAVLVRFARHGEIDEEPPSADRLAAIDALPREARALLHRAQRHARDHVVIGAHTWDPERDAPSVDAL